MPASQTLNRGRTVLVLKSSSERARGKDLPSPVLYLGLVTLSGRAPSAISSDAFKREVCDVEGRKHQLTDVTLASCYDEITGDEKEELIGRFWQEESARARED